MNECHFVFLNKKPSVDCFFGFLVFIVKVIIDSKFPIFMSSLS